MNVRTLCLGILSLGPATGYEIKKLVEEGPFAHFLEASYGSIYPALTRLTEEGYVSLSEQSQEGRPDKKIYTMTRQGHERLVEELRAPPAEDKYRSEFLFLMLFSHLLEPDRVSGLIDDKIADYRQQLASMESDTLPSDEPGSHFVRGLGRAIYEVSIHYLEENRHLVERHDRASLTEPEGV